MSAASWWILSNPATGLLSQNLDPNRDICDHCKKDLPLKEYDYKDEKGHEHTAHLCADCLKIVDAEIQARGPPPHHEWNLKRILGEKPKIE